MAKIDLAKAVDRHGNAVRKSMQRGSGETSDPHNSLPVPEDWVDPSDENRPLPPRGTSFLREVGDLRLGNFGRNPRRL